MTNAFNSAFEDSADLNARSQSIDTPEIVRRTLNQKAFDRAVSEGLHPLLARIFASRIEDRGQSFRDLALPTLQSIAHPGLLIDANKAAKRLSLAIRKKERIGVLTDYDVDGITSHTIIHKALTEFFGVPLTQIENLIGHRMRDGYGVSDSLVDRILSLPERPAVILTADCGSSDEVRIARLKAAGIDVIVTDHHQIPKEGIPQSAIAVVSPTRDDCCYPDSTIAGCMVAWLLMSLLRQELIADAAIDPQTPKLGSLLPFVALGTVADCVSLGGSAINRAVVKSGLQIMNQSNEPCWSAYRKIAGDRFTLFNAGTLGFQLGPRINASSRMDDPYAALHYLMAKDEGEAMQFLKRISSDNEDRKDVERQMASEAKQMAKEAINEGAQGVAVFVDPGHPGVQGIVASRLVERFGRPTIVFTQAEDPEHLVASGRSVPGIHVRNALQAIDDQAPGLMVKFGGHEGAAGLTIVKSRLEEFKLLFDQAIASQKEQAAISLTPKRFSDGSLPADWIKIDVAQMLEQLEPFGREFEAPIFDGDFEVIDSRPVGSDRTHLLMTVRPQSHPTAEPIKAIWFKAMDEQSTHAPLSPGDVANLLYKLDINEFRGDISVQLLVDFARKKIC